MTYQACEDISIDELVTYNLVEQGQPTVCYCDQQGQEIWTHHHCVFENLNESVARDAMDRLPEHLDNLL